jgi:transposase
MSTPLTTPLAFDPQTLPDDVRLLKDLIAELVASLTQRTHELEGVQQRLDQLLRRLYGPRAERWDPNQPLLFADLNQTPAEPPPVADADAKDPGRSRKRPGHGRQPLPEHLPRKRHELDVSEAEKRCPCCGEQRCRIGEEVSSRLDYVPASLFVAETVRPKYACPKCETGVACAPLPPQVIDKGLPGPGLLAHLIVSKFADHLPLYRLEQIFSREGVTLARSTLCDWLAQAAPLFRPLYDCMHLEVVGSAVVHGDATSVAVQDRDGRGKTRTGCLWNFDGDALHPYRMFLYKPTANQDGPKEFLKAYGGCFQADAAGVYEPLFKTRPRLVEAGCWAHARRDFFEAKDSHPQPAHEALARIRRLYAIESEAKGLGILQRLAILQTAGDAEQEQRLADITDYAERWDSLQEQVRKLREAEAAWQQARADATLPLEQRLACWDAQEQLTALVDYRSWVLVRLKLRRFLAVPKLEAFATWLAEQRRVADLPKSLLGQALAYAHNHWAALVQYARDGAVDIDNNLAEQTLRQVALGRKNWLFLGSDEGGRTAEVHLTLVATCKGLGIEPFAYLRDILSRIRTHPAERLAELLPDRWARAQRRQLVEAELSKPPPTLPTSEANHP